MGPTNARACLSAATTPKLGDTIIAAIPGATISATRDEIHTTPSGTTQPFTWIAGTITFPNARQGPSNAEVRASRSRIPWQLAEAGRRWLGTCSTEQCSVRERPATRRSRRQRLLVYAQKTIGIGTIAIAQVVQPALAVVWSFLLLGETLRGGQFVGIAIAVSLVVPPTASEGPGAPVVLDLDDGELTA